MYVPHQVCSSGILGMLFWESGILGKRDFGKAGFWKVGFWEIGGLREQDLGKMGMWESGIWGNRDLGEIK